MSMSKPFLQSIPSLYRANAEDLMLTAWIDAQQKLIPTITRLQAVEQFKEYYGLSEDDMSMETACKSYERTKEKLNKYLHEH